jgi:methylphosphotriester-DNA--protein-cysteine methyltransferase
VTREARTIARLILELETHIDQMPGILAKVAECIRSDQRLFRHQAGMAPRPSADAQDWERLAAAATQIAEGGA